MTPLEHNKYVGLTHLVYGVTHILLTGVSMLFVGAILSTMRFPDVPDSDFSPRKFMFVIMAFAIVVNVVLSVPSFVASYAFLKRRSWAKVMGIIAAVIAAIHFPLGTAACVYTFWFLFSEAGKTLYGTPAQTLPPPPPSDWAGVEQQGLHQSYAPDMQPDWRG
jgi:hypothetical protein